jgi:hypothetical protein
MTRNKLINILENFENGNRTDARRLIRAYGVNKFFRELQDHVNESGFVEIFNMYHKNIKDLSPKQKGFITIK